MFWFFIYFCAGEKWGCKVVVAVLQSCAVPLSNSTASQTQKQHFMKRRWVYCCQRHTHTHTQRERESKHFFYPNDCEITVGTWERVCESNLHSQSPKHLNSQKNSVKNDFSCSGSCLETECVKIKTLFASLLLVNLIKGINQRNSLREENPIIFYSCCSKPVWLSLFCGK